MHSNDPEKEKKLILNKYRSLIQACHPITTADQRKTIRRAFNMAAEAHKDVRRKSGEPYILHPIEVAIMVVKEIGLGTTSIICALLHDVVEDSDFTLEDIRSNFGEKVARIIDGLTKISGILDTTDTSSQAESIRKMLLTLSDDVRVILIKLADRLHNMRTLDAMPQHKQMKIASETLLVYAPLAHRLGLYAFKSELEDLSMKITEPGIYEEITSKLKASEDERKRFINRFITPIKRELTQQGIKFRILARTKSAWSIWIKMRKKQIPFEEVYDIFAIRIIIDSPVEQEKVLCWKVYSIVTDFYHPNPERLRDWISIPKSTGYSSLHTTVMSHEGSWVEIQVRSERMDEIAERGLAAHWKYKGSGSIEAGIDEWLGRIREILQQPELNAIDFIDDFRLNLFYEEILVFTPKGDIKRLPNGSTILDFAYAVHSEVGNHCIGAKVNYKLVPLNHPLRPADQVEIITSKKQSPKEEWLGYVITGRARTALKSALKEEKKKLTDIGRSILERDLKQLGITFSNESVKNFQSFLSIPSLTDFYYKIAIGEIGLNELKAFNQSLEPRKWLSYLTRPFTRNPKANLKKSLGESVREQLREKPGSLLLDEELDESRHHLASCCNPIPGDEVIGFVEDDKSITIHRTNCPKAMELSSKYGDRLVKTKWMNQSTLAFLTGIKILAIDKMGLLLEITRIISDELNVNIRSFNIESSEGMSEGTAMLYVNNTKHLDDLIRKLKKVNGIEKVVRID
jgi:GTP diphosphokinase / guanosine-3',5'-bis(diphosphate) 3'-diphosphatase